MEKVTGRVQVTHQFLAEKFWTTEEGAAAKEGARLDHQAVLPKFIADNVHFRSDEHVAEFYAQGGDYEAIKEIVIRMWPKTQQERGDQIV